MKARVIKTGEIIDVVPQTNPNAVSALDTLYSSDYRIYKGWELNFINDMEAKEIKITPPEGYEIDKENSTLECIKFKKKVLTYKDVAKELFRGKNHCFISLLGEITSCTFESDIYDGNNATSEKQLEKLLAINKLMNVAKYLNGDWKPDWDNYENKYYLYINKDDVPCTGVTTCDNISLIYFRNPENIKEVINILGEDTIRLALSTDW